MANKKKSGISLNNLRDYLVQVSLIIISLVIAIGVDRCNQSVKNESILQGYIHAIHQELLEEQDATKNNIEDCNNDIEDLYIAAKGFTAGSDEALKMSIGSTARVFVRGVFRAFSPTSFDVMIKSGHGLLMEDLELRQNLAGVMAFRENYVKADLLRHDELTLKTIDDFSEYLDLSCMRTSKSDVSLTCLTNRQLAKENGAKDLVVLALHAELRAFHLQLYQKRLSSILPILEEAMDK